MGAQAVLEEISPMRSTMPDFPLTIAGILHHGTTVYGRSEIVTLEDYSPEAGVTLSRTSFAQIGENAARLAHGLRELGVSGDDRVATFMWNNAEHMAAYFGIPAMGAVLHTLNLRLFPEQLTYIANHAEDKVIIVDDSIVPLLARVIDELKTVQTLIVTGVGAKEAGAALEGGGRQVLTWDEVLAGKPTTFDWPEVEEASAAAMCYTSGTTGNPKGVVYSHRSTYLHSMGACTRAGLGLADDQKVLPIVPMFHVNAWGLPYAAFMSGASLLMPDRFLQAEPIVKLIEAEKPTCAGAVPTIWNDVLNYGRANGSDLSSLQNVICGGSAVPRTLTEAFEESFGVRITQAWGMTETSPLGSVALVPHDDPDSDPWQYRCTAGRLVQGVECRITADDGTVLPNDGESVGEIEVRGPWVTTSYFGVEDPEKFHDGWLRTGDVGMLSDRGYITISDRAKDVIKSGGEWISSIDLENEIAAHAAVLECAVVAVPDDRWQERPLACVVLREGASATVEELTAFLAERVVRWWLPERWAFIDGVPRTSVGKYDKKVLRARYAKDELTVVTV